MVICDGGLWAMEADLWARVFWQNDSGGINQYEDFWQVVAKNVKVYRNNVAALDEDAVILEPRGADDGEKIRVPADVLVYCTGWSVLPSLFEDATASHIGLPSPLKEEDSAWKALDAKADVDTLSRFPGLMYPPSYRVKHSSYAPFRLYKTMAPISADFDRSVLFLGRLVTGNNFLLVEVQALWAVAYLDGHLQCSPAEMRWDVAKMVTWSRRRYLNKGWLGYWFFFDVVEYSDMLLAQMGLRSHRSSWRVPDALFPWRPKDLKGLLEEYKAKYPI